MPLLFGHIYINIFSMSVVDLFVRFGVFVVGVGFHAMGVIGKHFTCSFDSILAVQFF